MTTREPPTDRSSATDVAGRSPEESTGAPAPGPDLPHASPFPTPSGNGPASWSQAAAPEGATTTRTSDLSVGQLVSHASQQLGDLVRMELQLAAAEMREKGRHAGAGAGLLGGAAVVALYGAGAVVFAAIAALALVLPLWAAALIIGVLLFIIAAAMAVTGKQEVGRAVPPIPDETVASTKRDVNEITERAHR